MLGQRPRHSVQISCWWVLGSMPWRKTPWVMPDALQMVLLEWRSCWTALQPSSAMVISSWPWRVATIKLRWPHVWHRCKDSSAKSWSNEVDTDEKFASFVASLAFEQRPLQESLRAIWATRLAHQELPLWLLNGRTLVPFTRLRKKQRSSHWRYPHDLSLDDD